MRFPTLNGFAGLFGLQNQRRESLLPEEDRFHNYNRFLRAYEGYRSRLPGSPSTTAQQLALAASQRVRFNFNRPVVNLGAVFLAGKPLQWTVDDNPEATAAANAIWDRSGAERSFLKAARACGIYGDMAGLAVLGADGTPHIEFINPTICTPTFHGSDASQLRMLQIAWKEEDELGREVAYLETYTEDGREVRVDGEVDPAQSQSWERLPARWIRNLSLEGHPYGKSDLQDVADLVEEYDHIMRKRGQILDYYAAPSIIFEGVQKGDLQKDTNTVFYLPPGGKAYFLEWSGSPPDVEEQLTRIREDIGEVSQVPDVAFGKRGSGTAESGVSLEIRFGPMLAKTDDKRANWGPDLEYLMWLCLQAEGHAVDPGAVNVSWPYPLPLDTEARAREKKTEVDAGLKSHRTAMSEIGVEDPETELLMMATEKQIGTLLTPAPPTMGPDGEAVAAEEPESPEDVLLSLAALLDAEQGMLETRAARREVRA